VVTSGTATQPYTGSPSAGSATLVSVSY
jgi:hypothetical protein